MNERHRLDDHVIDLELVEIETGLYRWRFYIDGDHMTTSSAALQSLAVARQDALLIAQLEIGWIALRLRATNEVRA